MFGDASGPFLGRDRGRHGKRPMLTTALATPLSGVSQLANEFDLEDALRRV